MEAGLAQGERLSQLLLAPVRDDLASARRVTVVPDGSLHALNFETLSLAGSRRYWIEDVELAVAPSLSVLAESPRRNRSKPSIFVIGAPVSPGRDYPDLPAAKAEIEAIQQWFEGQESLVRTGGSATPHGFLDSKPSRFSMIHFAAHAEANPESPLESAVILSKEHDGYKLYARDIAALKLSADLVTISACRSAGARTYGGEGLVGFTWAFLQSGVHAVIAGLWDVGDASSSRLIGALYEALAAGKTPAAALRQAKLGLLRSGGAYRKPYYWAPYQIYVR
jgi:CHAT domain-containing protein